MILAGDIGGTKTHLALFPTEGPRSPVRQETFASGDFKDLDAIVTRFLTQGAQVTAACFGVAGPVFRNRAEATNLPWVIDGERLAGILGIPRAWIINDLEATGYGIGLLTTDEFFTLNVGDPSQGGNRAVIAAGTGLGEAILFWNGEAHLPSASEGGHADFAPRNALEIALLQYLLGKFDRVSCERVISGMGLPLLYAFLKDTGHGTEPPWLTEAIAVGDPNVVITETALEGTVDLCVKTLDLFIALYGAEAGNLALKAKATGGVYVGGGIAPKILPKLRAGGFMAAFTAKGRFAEFMQAIPVHVILNPQAALLGAFHFARRQRAVPEPAGP